LLHTCLVDTKQFQLDKLETAGQNWVDRQAVGQDINMKTEDPVKCGEFGIELDR